MIVWWDLADSVQTIDSLRDRLADEGDGEGQGWEGLRAQTWAWDDCGNRWGAVFLWRSQDCVPEELSSSAGALIGYPPTDRWAFDVVVGAPRDGADSGVRLVLRTPAG